MLLICNILNKTKLNSNKQRSSEDFIGTSFVLIDADLLLIWMNNFQLCFRFYLPSCPVLPAVLIISRGECSRKEIAVSQLSAYHFLPDFSMKTGQAKTCRRFYLHTTLKSLDFMFLKSCTIKSSYRNKHVSSWARFDFLLSSKVDFWVNKSFRRIYLFLF